MDDKLMRRLAVKGAQALGGMAVEATSSILKEGMEEREMGEDKLEALDTVTGVCKDMVPDMAGKAVDGFFSDQEEIPEDLED